MNKMTVSTLALMAALISVPAAHAAEATSGWYVGGGLGAALGQDPILHGVTGKHSARDEDVNLDLLANAGYAYGNGIRLEGEYFHNQINKNNVDKLSGAGGNVTNNALFLNALYDFHNSSMFTPYVGAGIGGDFANVKSVGANGVGFLKGETLVGAYQGIAGVSTQLDANWAITADYRYIATLSPKVDSTAGGQGRLDNASHNLIVGVRYSFGGEEPKAAPMHAAMAPMVSPQAPMKPMVAAMPQNFMVFFDFNKSVLTPEAKRIIASAAQEFKKGHFVNIAVTGHTDTVGTAAYNEKLSNARAKAVKAELVKLGVSTSNVKEAGVGKGGLMVPTADGVREAQNRRAEIVLTK